MPPMPPMGMPPMGMPPMPPMPPMGMPPMPPMGGYWPAHAHVVRAVLFERAGAPCAWPGPCGGAYARVPGSLIQTTFANIQPSAYILLKVGH